MIFVSVGTQLPFDRLIKTVDHWAKENQKIEIFAQIGDKAYQPQNISWKNFISPLEVKKK